MSKSLCFKYFILCLNYVKQKDTSGHSHRLHHSYKQKSYLPNTVSCLCIIFIRAIFLKRLQIASYFTESKMSLFSNVILFFVSLRITLPILFSQSIAILRYQKYWMWKNEHHWASKTLSYWQYMVNKHIIIMLKFIRDHF